MAECFVPTDYLLAAAEAALGASRTTPAASAKRVEQTAIWTRAWEATCRRELRVALPVVDFAKIERFYTGPEPIERE